VFDDPEDMAVMRMVKYNTEDGGWAAQQIGNGNTKLQWKVDWAMRWVHFDVDYEMSGKDLIESVRLSSKICRVLGGTPPLNLTYELFLDEHGAKISKSKGNGFSIEDWLRVGTYEGLMFFMFQNPRAAKKLYRDLVPGIEDQYIASRTKELTPDVPAWHFTTIYQAGLLPDIGYQLMVNLARVSQVGSGPELLTYLEENRPVDPLHRPWLLQLAKLAIEYSVVSGLYNRDLRVPTDEEQAAFKDLADQLSTMEPGLDAEAYQFQVYEVGKAHGFEPLRTWFQALYECFLGDSSGPRFGAFIAANGLQNTIKILRMYEDGAK
jgi:lysyl-tRNA synthetase class 1